MGLGAGVPVGLAVGAAGLTGAVAGLGGCAEVGAVAVVPRSAA